jgi:hypothetical protein
LAALPLIYQTPFLGIGEKLIEEYRDEPKLYHVYLLYGASYSIRGQHDVAIVLLRKAEALSMRSVDGAVDGAKELIGTFGSGICPCRQNGRGAKLSAKTGSAGPRK